MQLTIISIVSEHHCESDYETAIDMSHCSQSTTVYKLLSLSGVCLTLTMEESYTHYSYLEPDFDFYEKTGECVYERHASEDPGSHQVSMRATVNLPPRRLLLTEQDFRNRNLWETEQFEALGHLTYDAEERLHGFAYSDPDFLSLSDDSALFERLEIYKEGQQLDASLVLPELLETLQENEQLARQILNENASFRLQNMATEAIFNLSCWRRAQVHKFERDLTDALADFRALAGRSGAEEVLQ